MEFTYTKEQIKERLQKWLTRGLDVENTDTYTHITYYKAAAAVTRDIAIEKRKTFLAHNLAVGKKQVHYLSMEFLLGRSLKNNLSNLGITEPMRDALLEYGADLDDLYENEPDAGLGNGGLGRLAACYLDALAHEGYLATGHCILYEYGIFKQKIIEGWQSELPDEWLPGGEIWLTPNPLQAVEVHFGGNVEESWEDGYHIVEHKNYSVVKAIPYDIYVPGYNCEGVSLLRVWQAKTPVGMDMDLFNRGDYASAFQQSSVGEAISKVLYPNDNHYEGKSLRLRQQYFLCAAAISDICRRHLAVYGSLANFAEKNAIHINDTHPTLAIPELMRFLLDDCGYGWDASWEIVTKTFAYTNHTVMREAMECWDENLFRTLLPRIFSIVCEINRRHCTNLFEKCFVNQDAVHRMSIVGDHSVRMANLAVVGSHSVNGVSGLHTQILKESVFRDFYAVVPEKFNNVTNGIASRRWLLQANPGLTGLIKESIGADFADDLSSLKKLNDYREDRAFLEKLAAIKRANKERFCRYIARKQGVQLDPDSIFDVQVKRLHEYKRQTLNALDILATYTWLRENPGTDITPRTYIFGAKAAPGYFLAKQIIRMICALADKIERDPIIRKKMRVIFLEEYNVSLSELLMPASDISEQISLAGYEASGTGNMKLMLNGAVTLGTLDGANVEIREAVGDENIFIFGMDAPGVAKLRTQGYNPWSYYENNETIRRAADFLRSGLAGDEFEQMFHCYVNTDYYLNLPDFAPYRKTRKDMIKLYAEQPEVWHQISLRNIAQSGVFCADRAVREYAADIWGLD